MTVAPERPGVTCFRSVHAGDSLIYLTCSDLNMYAVCRVTVVIRIVVNACFGILDAVECYGLAGADTQCGV